MALEPCPEAGRKPLINMDRQTLHARAKIHAPHRTKNGIAAHEERLTVYIATKVRTGLTPAVNALGLILIALTVIAAATYELSRRNNRAKSVRSNSG